MIRPEYALGRSDGDRCGSFDGNNNEPGYFGYSDEGMANSSATFGPNRSKCRMFQL